MPPAPPGTLKAITGYGQPTSLQVVQSQGSETVNFSGLSCPPPAPPEQPWGPL